MTTRLLTLFIFGLSVVSCQIKPEPLAFGKDACHACKMTLVDRKFGGEVVTKKGKVYKFDDIGCMMGFYKSDNEPIDNISHCLVVNFGEPEKLIDATTAFYIRSEAIRSPMGSHVAAFSTEDERTQYNEDSSGETLTWVDLLAQQNR